VGGPSPRPALEPPAAHGADRLARRASVSPAPDLNLNRRLPVLQAHLDPEAKEGDGGPTCCRRSL
jgi:hypothetical protein